MYYFSFSYTPISEVPYTSTSGDYEARFVTVNSSDSADYTLNGVTKAQLYFAEGQEITVNAGTRDGYSFKEWSISSEKEIVMSEGNINTSSVKFTMPNGDVSLTARWNPLSSDTSLQSVSVSDVEGEINGNTINVVLPYTTETLPTDVDAISIELADAYYGDPSSLIKLCQEKGISVMVQDVTEERILWEDIKPNIQAYPELLEMVRVGEYLYGFARECNALLRVDLEDGNVNYVDSVVQETENEILFHNTKEYNGYVVFSPYNATKVGVYDTRMNEFIFFNEQNAVNKNKAKKVGQSVVHNNTIHFLPLFAKDMLSVDMENRSVRTSDWLYRAYSHYTGNGEESFNRCSVYQHENCVFAAIMGTNYIMEILFNTESCIFYQLDEKVIQLMGYGNNLYMVTKDKKVIQWSIAEKKLKKLWKTDLKKNELSEYLLGSIIIGNVVYFLRQGITGSIGKQDFGIKIDTKQEQVSVISVKEEFGIETEGNEQYSFFYMDKEGNVYFISSHRNMQIYNIHTQKVKKLSLKYSKELRLKNILKRTERYIGKECWLAMGETVI